MAHSSRVKLTHAEEPTSAGKSLASAALPSAQPAKPPPPRRSTSVAKQQLVGAKPVTVVAGTQPPRPRPVERRVAPVKVPQTRVAIPRPSREAAVLAQPSSSAARSPSPTSPIAPMPIVRVEPPACSEETPAVTNASPLPSSNPIRPSLDEPPAVLLDESPAVSLNEPPAVASEQPERELTPAGVQLPPQPIALVAGEPTRQNDATRLVANRSSLRLLLGGSAILAMLALGLGLRLFTKQPALVPHGGALGSASTLSTAPAPRAPEATPATTAQPATPANAAAVATAANGATTQSLPTPPSPSSSSPQPQALSDTRADSIPDYVSKPALLHLGSIAIRRAEHCHPHGHAVGSARVFVTFAPTGRVSDARIEGEPVASAPVASCILGHAHAIRLAKFDGAPFTHELPITMR